MKKKKLKRAVLLVTDKCRKESPFSLAAAERRQKQCPIVLTSVPPRYWNGEARLYIQICIHTHNTKSFYATFT